VPGAEEGETLKVLENNGRAGGPQGLRTVLRVLEGSWSGTDHLFWSPRMIGDRLRVEFAAGETAPGRWRSG
jgi:hypothetical protein